MGNGNIYFARHKRETERKRESKISEVLGQFFFFFFLLHHKSNSAEILFGTSSE